MPDKPAANHPASCEFAKPDSPCVCGCGGKYHAIGWSQEYQTALETPITEALGGEVGEIIKKMKGKTIDCRCGNTVTIIPLFGYLHDDGFSDADGDKWWLYTKCEKCHYDWSIWKILAKIGG